MARYIDLDMVEYLIDHFGGMVTWNKKEILGELKKRVQIHSTADVVEVVRCKDCIWCKESEVTNSIYCDWHREYYETFPNDYCCYGERKK